MEILLISFIIILTTLNIGMLIIDYLLENIVERFEIEEEIDNLFKENITSIYKILESNNLITSIKDKETER